MKLILDREDISRPVLAICLLGIYVIGIDFYKMFGERPDRKWTNYFYVILLDSRIGFTFATPDK